MAKPTDGPGLLEGLRLRLTGIRGRWDTNIVMKMLTCIYCIGWPSVSRRDDPILRRFHHNKPPHPHCCPLYLWYWWRYQGTSLSPGIFYIEWNIDVKFSFIPYSRCWWVSMTPPTLLRTYEMFLRSGITPDIILTPLIMISLSSSWPSLSPSPTLLPHFASPPPPSPCTLASWPRWLGGGTPPLMAVQHQHYRRFKWQSCPTKSVTLIILAKLKGIKIIFNNKYKKCALDIFSSHICAGDSNKDSCQGDSGGPLKVSENGR